MSAVSRIELPLILGGHSFIAQLGSDPRADPDLQVAIVRRCIDLGIYWVDTTYQPERIALGEVLARLPRRAYVRVMAWNFFRDFDDAGDLGGADYYEPHHLQLILDQLQSDTIDSLVVHWLDDDKRNREQEELAIRWVNDGKVKRLGIWGAPTDAAKRYTSVNPYSFVVRPVNITTGDCAESLAWARSLRWRNVGTSPFVRGWHLDKLIKKAIEREGGTAADWSSKISGLLLRYSLYQPNVDAMIVAMRKPEWVEANAAAVMKGDLAPEERAWLVALNAAL